MKEALERDYFRVIDKIRFDDGNGDPSRLLLEVPRGSEARMGLGIADLIFGKRDLFKELMSKAREGTII